MSSANKKMSLVLSRETVKNLNVSTKIRTGELPGSVPPTTASQYCPVHTLGNQCIPPGTRLCPM